MDGLKTLMKSPRMQGYSGLQYRLIALCQSPRQNASPRSRYDTPSGNMVERVAHAPAAPRAIAIMRQLLRSRRRESFWADRCWPPGWISILISVDDKVIKFY